MKKNVIWGILFILLAVYLVISRLELIPALPVFKIVLTILFVYGILDGIKRKSFFESVMSLAFLCWIYDALLGIEKITPWVLLGAGLLLGIGLELIFKKAGVNYYGNAQCNYGGTTTNYTNNGENVSCENFFGGTSKYISANPLRHARIENNFGELNVYFENSIPIQGGADVRVENNFGETKLYFPNTWRIENRQNAAFGNVRLFGQGSSSPDAPLVRLNTECNFGSVKIFFSC